MTSDPRKDLYLKTVALLKPALDRILVDPVFRERLETAPLAVLDELGVALDAATRAELQGKRFSEFWAARRKTVEGPVEVRDLPPGEQALSDQQLESVTGGTYYSFAPPYVPVGPVVMGDNTTGR